MNKHDRRELENDIEEALDGLDFDIDYSINIYHDFGTTVADIEFDIYDDDDDDDLPDDWDEQVEDVIGGVANDWGGYISWEDWTLSISIPD